MVLLVPETPTWGVDKMRLGQAFKIVDDYRKSPYRDGSGPIRIVGPNFSGSIPSMVMEINTWGKPDIAPSPRFVIYNGVAQNPQLDVLREAFPKGQVTFRSTVHNTATLVQALRDFTLKTFVSDTLSVGSDLRWMSSLNDVSGIPTAGKNLIIVADVNNVLHFRIFDGDCKVVVDTDEKRLTEQAPQIKDLRDLRKQLESSLWPPHELTRSENGRIITAVTSIVDHIRPIRRALLTESNTVFGQHYSPKGERHPENVETRFFEQPPWDPRFQVDPYVFPMNISRLREEYTAQGYYRSNEPIQLSAPERLSLQAMTGKEGDLDLMPSFTPSPTAVEGEMILAQMLQEVERLRYPWIGIIATNPHDQLFLAYEVRQVCPDARLYFTTATSLFTHHDIVPYLRGSLVASTYPLYLGTQSWTVPMNRDQHPRVTRVGFSNDFTEGIYNATVAHLAQLDPNSPSPPDFLDYRFPGGAEAESLPRRRRSGLASSASMGSTPYPSAIRPVTRSLLRTRSKSSRSAVSTSRNPSPARSLRILKRCGPDSTPPGYSCSWRSVSRGCLARFATSGFVGLLSRAQRRDGPPGFRSARGSTSSSTTRLVAAS